MKALSLSLAVLFLTASCRSGTIITTSPTRADVVMNGELVTEQTPHEVRPKTTIFDAETEIRIRAPGYHDRTIMATQTLDRECAAATIGASVGGALFFVFPIVGLFYLPWCTQFEEREYSVRLDPAPLPPVSSRSDR